MAITFTRFSQWMLRGGDQKPRKGRKKSPPPSSTDFPSGFRESELPVKLNFNFSPSPSSSSAASSRRLRKRRGSSREDNKKIDKEHDMVIVPSDGGGGCISGSESDSSDWSIGWLEPHPREFCASDGGESEDSFAVLVPCYRHALAMDPLERVNPGFSFGVRMPTHEDLPESNEFLQQWLSSLTSDPLV